MKTLIIGGTGNIGTGIVRGLLAVGAAVTLFKRTPAVPEWMTGVCVRTGDRRDTERLAAAVAGQRFDSVIDMVCFEPREAEAAAAIFAGRTEQVIFCSTVDVYRKYPCSYPIRETDPPGASPGFPYGHKKMQCEEILWQAHARGDFALTVFRPAATYNDAASPGVHSFGSGTYHLDRLLKGRPIILHGDGNSIWAAAHRDDVSVPFANAAGNRAAYGQAYNVAGDEWMTQNGMWRTIARAIGAPEPEFVYIPATVLGALAPREAEWCVANFQYNNIFDTAKVKRDLGFRYTIRYEEGVRRCFHHLTAHGRIESCDNYPFYDRIVERWRTHIGRLMEEFRA